MKLCQRHVISSWLKLRPFRIFVDVTFVQSLISYLRLQTNTWLGEQQTMSSKFRWPSTFVIIVYSAAPLLFELAI
jgi:hypothetical protein